MKNPPTLKSLVLPQYLLEQLQNIQLSCSHQAISLPETLWAALPILPSDALKDKSKKKKAYDFLCVNAMLF